MKRVYFKCRNGMGDKLLDVLGGYVICKFMNFKLCVNFNPDTINYPWGTNYYDERLFLFEDIELSSTNDCEYMIQSINPSASLCPYNTYQFLLKHLSSITFDEVSASFIECGAKIIKPSPLIEAKMPTELNLAHGIHLRSTDKVNNNGNNSHENTNRDMAIIMKALLDDVDRIINVEKDPLFLIVSEDKEWKNSVTDIIKHKSSRVRFLEINYETSESYENYESVMDMFCLSRCKQIIQGVKYSTYSILAVLIGEKKLVNYSNLLDCRDYCIIHNWVPVLNTNIEFDIEKTKATGSCAKKIITNIEYN